MFEFHTRIIQNFRAQRLGANVISSTTSLAPMRGAQNIKTVQEALAYDFCRPIPTFSLRESFHRESSASAHGRYFLSAQSKAIVCRTLYGDRQPFCVDGAFFCAPLGRERGPANDLARAQEGRSKYHDPPKALIITPPALLSALRFEVLT